MHLVKHLSENPQIIVNGLNVLAAGIPSVSRQRKGKPMIDEHLVDESRTQYDSSEDKSRPASSNLKSEDDNADDNDTQYDSSVFNNVESEDNDDD